MQKESFKLLKIFAAAAVLAVLAIVPTVSANAAKKKTTVYVVSQITSKDTRNSTELYKMTYNSKGLVTKTLIGDISPIITEHIYKKGRIVKEIQNSDGKKSELYYSYNKKGQVKKITGIEADGQKTVSTLKYKKGLLVQMKDGGTGSVWNFTNKKGLPRKLVLTIMDKYKQTIKYSYNSKKEISKIDSPNVVQKFKYTYKNKRRDTMIVSYEYKSKEDQKYNSTETYKYTYKKLKVSSSMVSKIKKQQKKLLKQGDAFLYVSDY